MRRALSAARTRALAAAFAATLAAAAPLAAPNAARAWTCSQIGCPAWDGEIPVALGPLSNDLEALAPGTTLVELERAVADWSLLACSDVPFGAPSTTDAPLGTADGVSTIGFVDADWPFDAAAIGVTSLEIGFCGSLCIVEADIAFNAESFDWVTIRGSLPEVNARSILLHELGHYIGLGHSAAEDAVMNPSYSRGYLALGPDDEEGACELYPREGEAPDCAVAGCPFGSACVEGACVPSAPESCVTAMDCARDERCIEATGRCVRQFVTVPGLGEPCETHADCESQECADLPEGRRCTLTCDGLDPRSCPTGFYCDPGLTDTCATGLCVTGMGGDGAFGSPCEAATDCASLFCEGGVCSLPCDAAQANNCPAGRTCHPDVDTGCGACLSPLPTGEPCLLDTQCASSLCYAESPADVGVCTVPCVDATECPAGFRCAPVGAESLCLPPPPRSGGCAVGGAAGATGPAGGGAGGGVAAALGLAAVMLLGRRRLPTRDEARRADACQPANPT